VIRLVRGLLFLTLILGAQALEFCHDDERCNAGIDVDGAPLGAAVRDGVRQPFLFLLSDHTGEPGSAQILADVHAIYDRLPSGRRRLVVIPGANHFAFSDDGALLKSRVFRLFLRASGRLRIDSRQQLAITREELRKFFDAQLNAEYQQSRHQTTTEGAAPLRQ
jgi:predicted dienelactone hydrolase